MRYYAVGSKKQKDEVTGEFLLVSRLIPLTETKLVLAVKQAERIARKERIKLEYIRPAT